MRCFSNIFPLAQQDIYPQLAQCKNYGFILFEGTAIALQLAHRQSIDFDFFIWKHLMLKQKNFY